MTELATEYAELLDELTCGDAEARQFLDPWWRDYCHLIDDLADGHALPEQAVRMGALAVTLYSLPFYRRHADRLQVVVLLVTNAFADSLELEQRPEPYARRLASVMRHAGGDLVRAVALICGGYDHLRRISPRLHLLGLRDQHYTEGEEGKE